MRSKLLQLFIEDLKPVVPYTGRWLLKFPASVAADTTLLWSSIKQVNLKQTLVMLGRLLLNFVKYPVHFCLTSTSLGLNAIASLINNVLANNIERPLSESEIRYLQSIFANNLNYASIRIQFGGIKERLRISPQAVGNDIFMRKFWGSDIANGDGSLTHAGLCLLGHEACHVWQFQTDGAAYIGDSLITQALDYISRKSSFKLSDGYNVTAALHAGMEFEQCNVEQQAVLAETIGAACLVSGSEAPQQKDINRFLNASLNDAQYQSVLHAHQILKGGE